MKQVPIHKLKPGDKFRRHDGKVCTVKRKTEYHTFYTFVDRAGGNDEGIYTDAAMLMVLVSPIRREDDD